MRSIVVAGLIALFTTAGSVSAYAAADVSPRAAFPPLVEPPARPVTPPPTPVPQRAPAAPEVRPAAPAPDTGEMRWGAPVESAPVPRDRGATQERHRLSDDWMLAIEAVTHAPLDVGVQLGLEVPYGFRLSAGYGVVPSPYLGLVTRTAGSVSNADPLATALITDGFQGGHTWRVQGGIRPFPKLGLYLDAGYARVALSGQLDSANVPGVAALGVSGGYSVATTLDMWLVELGYQAHIGDHFVLAVGAGVMGTLGAHTTVSTLPGSVRLPAVDSSTTSKADSLLEQHGFLPTLTLRLGADLI